MVGGGVIGCEYASIFTALGVEVSLVDGRDRAVAFSRRRNFRMPARTAGKSRRALFLKRAHRRKIERTQNGVRITLQSGKTIEAEAALFAAGRRGAVGQTGLEKAGVTLNKRGYIEVNENYRTAALRSMRRET